MPGAPAEKLRAEDPEILAARRRRGNHRVGDESVQRPNGTWWLYRRVTGRRLMVHRAPGRVFLVVCRTWDPDVAESIVRPRWDEKVGADVPLPEPVREWRVMAQPDGAGKAMWSKPNDGTHAKAFPALAYPLPPGVDMTG